MSLSDHKAYEKFTIRCMKYRKQHLPELQELLDQLIAQDGKPDPLLPLLRLLDYRTVSVEPDVHIGQCAEDIDPEILAKARDGAGTLIYCIIPDGQCTVRTVELISS